MTLYFMVVRIIPLVVSAIVRGPRKTVRRNAEAKRRLVGCIGGVRECGVQGREWLLTAAVILVPLIIAVVVTLWSLEQVRYRRKTWRAPSQRRDSADGGRQVDDKS